MWIIAVSAMLFLMFAGSLAIAQRGRTGGGQDQREPISIGILLEASRFESRMDAARDGIDLFLGTLEPDDEVFLMTVSDRPVLKQRFYCRPRRDIPKPWRHRFFLLDHPLSIEALLKRLRRSRRDDTPRR